MENKIHMQIITSEGVVCDEMVNYVEAPFENGNYGILSRHAPMLAALTEGVARYKIDEEEHYMTIMGGVLSVENNEVQILTQNAEHGEDIDLARAESARKRAEARLHERKQDLDMVRAEMSLHRAIARMKAYEKSHGLKRP